MGDGRGLDKGKRIKGKELRRGTLLVPWKEGAPWPASLFAPYPATELRSPHLYDAVLSAVSQHEMRCEMSFLPLTMEPIFEATTASLSSRLANTQRIHALALTDEWLP
jgi:hypothetical protein